MLRAKQEKRPTHIQSLQRAIDILELLEWYYGGLGLSQIADRLGLHASTAHHLLETMHERGYVAQDPNTHRYRLGPKLLNLASGFLRELNLNTVAFPHMKALCDACRENLRLGILGPDSVITIVKVDPHSTPAIHTPIDQWRAAHATGLGKVLLAGLSPAARRRFLERVGLPKLTPRTITDPVELEAELERINAQGYAHDRGELDEGLHCIAAPIRDRDGAVVAALSVTVPAYRFMDVFESWLISAVPRTATQISQELARADLPLTPAVVLPPPRADAHEGCEHRESRDDRRNGRLSILNGG